MKRALLIIVLILIADQALKFWVKTNMYIGENIEFARWAKLHFTENPGMAFGLEFGGMTGKTLLSIFRLITVGFIFYWLNSLVKKGVRPAAITAVVLIFAGALGNILDSALYGWIFNSGTIWNEELGAWQQYGGISKPNFEGYAGFLQGCVVDMFYFPLFRGTFPEWVPFKGGDTFLFFRPVFNLADTAISVGVGLLILFQKSVFGEKESLESAA